MKQRLALDLEYHQQNLKPIKTREQTKEHSCALNFLCALHCFTFESLVSIARSCIH